MARLTPRLPGPDDPTPTDGDLVYGDTQADLEGLEGLLAVAGWNPDTQRVFSIGDNVDRGPRAKEMLDFMDRYGIFSIMGNHDWKHVRYARFARSTPPAERNPIVPNVEMQDTIDQCGSAYLRYATRMKNFPLYLPFEDAAGKGYLMHAGPHPHAPIERQDATMMMIRRQHPQPRMFLPEETPEHPAWQRSYAGRLGHILHGHNGVPSADFWGNPYVTSLDGSGSIGRFALERKSVGGARWVGRHRLIRLGDRRIFEAPGSPESEAHYAQLLAKAGHGEEGR